MLIDKKDKNDKKHPPDDEKGQDQYSSIYVRATWETNKKEFT
jgi:hypothetical protein